MLTDIDNIAQFREITICHEKLISHIVQFTSFPATIIRPKMAFVLIAVEANENNHRHFHGDCERLVVFSLSISSSVFLLRK